MNQYHSPENLANFLTQEGAQHIGQQQPLPYNPFRNSLYTCTELMEGYQPGNDQSLDLKIYHHFEESRYHPPLIEALFQRIHDHAMDEGLRTLLGYDEKGMTSRKGVGIMGGHSTLRTDPFYQKPRILLGYLLLRDISSYLGEGLASWRQQTWEPIWPNIPQKS